MTYDIYIYTYNLILIHIQYTINMPIYDILHDTIYIYIFFKGLYLLPLNPWRSKMFQTPVDRTHQSWSKPIVNKQFVLNIAIEIVDLPIKKWWFSIVVCKKIPEGRGKWWKKVEHAHPQIPMFGGFRQGSCAPWGQSYLQPLRSLWQGAEGIIWCLWITWGWEMMGIWDRFCAKMFIFGLGTMPIPWRIHGAGIFIYKTGSFMGQMLGFIFQHHGSYGYNIL